MSLTMEYTGTLVIETCCYERCGMTFAMPREFHKQKRDDHQTWYCPRGHGQSYTSESELEKSERLRQNAVRRMEWAETARDAAREQAEMSERSRRATKGHLTRIRNKIANGVCPVAGCRRHFDNVQDHIASQHPDWAVIDPETGKAVHL